jgi:hypothetical protein
MLKDRVKQKAKSRAKQKVRSEAKSKVQQAGRKEGAPKVLKAAAVGGTAYYAGKKVQENRQEDQAEPYESPPASDAGMAAAAAGSDTVAQLQQLAQMHESGVLTDEEFASAKQRILAGG